MKVTVYDKDDPKLKAGTIDVPDDVMDAARKVSEWLDTQNMPIELYGIGRVD
jgi:hypothetical protein